MSVQVRTRMAASPGTLRSEQADHFLAAAFFLPFLGASSSGAFLPFFAISRVWERRGLLGKLRWRAAWLRPATMPAPARTLARGQGYKIFSLIKSLGLAIWTSKIFYKDFYENVLVALKITQFSRFGLFSTVLAQKSHLFDAF